MDNKILCPECFKGHLNETSSKDKDSLVCDTCETNFYRVGENSVIYADNVKVAG